MERGPAQEPTYDLADGKVACLLCEHLVLVNMAQWKEREMSAAICPPCYDAVSGNQRVVQGLFLLRSQISDLSYQVELLKADVKKLYTRH